MNRRGASVRLLVVGALTALLVASPAWAWSRRAHSFDIKAVRDRPKPRHPAAAARAITKLREQVAAKPRDRKLRFSLVQALVESGDLHEALRQARKWRAVDAYNLLVVRMLGDIQAQLGQRDAALRTWSAVVELLPNDAAAHRALASALKQAGETKAACQRLRRAVALRADDTRLRFELGVCQQRIGDHEGARKLFEGILADDRAPRLVRGPAKQRLGQLIGDKGATPTDIKVYLGWDTDRSDIDLWVTTPAGERVWYRNKHGKHGGALFGDVTTGYGPEMFTATRAKPGVYKVAVNYFGTTRRGLREARGEVVVVTHEGSPNEVRRVFPYRLYEPGQTVEVARVVASGARSLGGNR